MPQKEAWTQDLIAESFGQKLDIDKSEKLVMYDVTHVLVRDDYSGMIAAVLRMPIKNYLIINENIF